MFIFSAISSVTRFTTNSRVSRMFRAVSFSPVSRSPTDTPRTTGRLDTPMLKENGAQLSIPSRLTVDTKAIGRGMNAEIMRRYTWRSGKDDGSTIMRESRGGINPLAIRDSSDGYAWFMRTGRMIAVEPHGAGRIHPPFRSGLRHLQCARPLDPSGRPSTTNPTPDASVLAGFAAGP